jgi:alkylation response protein AidB-like acyl-CoA dehydrogenase
MTEAATTDTEDRPEMESVEAFAARARLWLAQSLEPGLPLYSVPNGVDEDAERAFVARVRALQRKIFDAGFAGICFPREYGGLGLSEAHQQAFNLEISGYQYPTLLQIPTFVPCAAVLLEFGTEEQKLRHLPAILAGEEVWMQFLSEPSGGSDVAGALTTAVRDGDEWIINGSKIWTSGAWYADYGLCLLRTNWDVPKHRGLSVFIIEIRQPGLELHRIEMIDGSREFCQEFMTDVRVSDACRIGEVDDGWTVGTRWMFHERNAMGGGSPYLSRPPTREGEVDVLESLYELARNTGQMTDPLVRDLLGEAHTLQRVQTELSARVGEGISTGRLSDASAGLARLMRAVSQNRRTTIGMELAGSAVVASGPDDPAFGFGANYLVRQSSSIGGGTTEMARNNIAERVLGMPREMTHDKAMPYRDVPKGPSSQR